MKSITILKTLQILFVTLWLPAVLHAAPISGAIPKIDGLFYETSTGRVNLPASWVAEAQQSGRSHTNPSDGRVINIAIRAEGNSLALKFSSQPDADILKWGVALEAGAEEYFTGLMERVVDGPQQSSWAKDLTAAMNLRGQTVEMILKPTTSVYAPFFLSSRGYAVSVGGTWPGRFDFCVGDRQRVKIEFEGACVGLEDLHRCAPRRDRQGARAGRWSSVFTTQMDVRHVALA
jgi:hypothetical protein